MALKDHLNVLKEAYLAQENGNQLFMGPAGVCCLVDVCVSYQFRCQCQILIIHGCGIRKEGTGATVGRPKEEATRAFLEGDRASPETHP